MCNKLKQELSKLTCILKKNSKKYVDGSTMKRFFSLRRLNVLGNEKLDILLFTIKSLLDIAGRQR
jgi:hypothetical protein